MFLHNYLLFQKKRNKKKEQKQDYKKIYINVKKKRYKRLVHTHDKIKIKAHQNKKK